MKYKLFFLFFFVLFSFSLVESIGVSPPIYKVDFESGSETDFSFTVSNNVGKDISAKITIMGDLAEFITVSDNNIPLPVNSRKSFFVTLNLPENVEVPGIHRIQVRIQEQSELGGGMGARAGVIALIIVDVPFPGEYAAITSFSVASGSGGVNEGEDTPISFSIKNQGTKRLENTRVEISFFNNEGVLQEKSSFEDINLASQETYTKSLLLNTKNSPPSDYFAVVKYFYANKVKEKSINFRVGSFDVALTNYTKEVVQEGIISFNLKTSNLWKGDLFVEASLSIGELVSTQSSRVKFIDFQTKNIELFFDANALPLGENNGEVRFSIEKIDSGEVMTKIVPISFSVIKFKEPRKELPAFLTSPITIILIALIILLLVNVAILGKVFLKKKFKKR